MGFGARHRWPGTYDPAACLSVPSAIDFLTEHDWDEVRAGCRALTAEAAARLVVLGIRPLAPDESWLCQMVAGELPECDVAGLKSSLYDRHRVEVPVQRWDDRPLVRASLQGYNDERDLDALVDALRAELG